MLVLGNEAASPTLPIALTRAVDGPSRVLVIDCLAVRQLGPSLRAALVAAHQTLDSDHRHMIVVNAPTDELAPLREHGVDVAATTDQEFAESGSSGYAHGSQLI